METKETFPIGDHQYEIKMWIEHDVGKWYEIWRDGTLLGKRNDWPLNAETRQLLTKQELIDEKKSMFAEQQRRKKEAGV
jgi:hypothetical protein